MDHIIIDTFTEDFWNITLPIELSTSAPRSPSLFAYYASLNILDARALFSKIKVSELLDPALKSTRSAIERHHLFPKKYLDKIGITDIKDINRIGNFALLVWPDNTDISAQAPAEYFPQYASRVSDQMQFWHALPAGWEHMQYNEFLVARRKAIAKVIRLGFERLSRISEEQNEGEQDSTTVEELIKRGEPNTLELKSSMRWDYKANQKGTEIIQLGV